MLLAVSGFWRIAMQLLPPLPTDNLYKFMALSGLVALLVRALYPPLALQGAAEAQVEIVTADEVFKHDAAELTEEVAVTDGATREAEKAEEVDANGVQWLKELIEGNREKLASVRVQGRALEVATGKAAARLETKKAHLALAHWLLIPAAALMIGGLLLWYVKVQRLRRGNTTDHPYPDVEELPERTEFIVHNREEGDEGLKDLHGDLPWPSKR
jgi:hypothetical protein